MGMSAACGLLLSACNLATPTPVAAVQPTVPVVRIAQAATITPASASRELQPIPTNTPLLPTRTPSPTTAPYRCESDPSGEHIQHDVAATIDYAARRAAVAQLTRYRNISEDTLSSLVLDVQPNIREGAFALSVLRINGADADYTLIQNRLEVRLPQPLKPGCTVPLQMQFEVAPPLIRSDIQSLRGFFGHSERQLNLSVWLPTVAPYYQRTWLIHEPQSVGEQLVLEQADWQVSLTVENAAKSLKIAAPGQVEQTAPNRWQYSLLSARDFSVSLSESFRVQRATLENGVIVEVYHFPDATRPTDSGLQDAAAHTLNESVKAMEQFISLFGAYPYERMVIVQGDFPDGMEFSGMVFVSTAWFYTYEGGVQNYLTLITVHELAHQWWYARVGNDAALTPWLDEALSTYSEYIYYEEFYPDLKNWWWSFRVGWYNPQGDVDSTVYEFESVRAYINAIYLRGVQMLHNLREDIGTEAFFDLLADYVETADGGLASPDVFWSLLPPEQFEATLETRRTFFRNLPEQE